MLCKERSAVGSEVLGMLRKRALLMGMSKESGVPTEGRSTAKRGQKSRGGESPEEVA